MLCTSLTHRFRLLFSFSSLDGIHLVGVSTLWIFSTATWRLSVLFFLIFREPLFILCCCCGCFNIIVYIVYTYIWFFFFCTQCDVLVLFNYWYLQYLRHLLFIICPFKYFSTYQLQNSSHSLNKIANVRKRRKKKQKIEIEEKKNIK